MNNLDQAIAIVARIAQCIAVQNELKRAFKDDELDGGWKAALTHPLYLQAEAEVSALRDELKGLI